MDNFDKLSDAELTKYGFNRAHLVWYYDIYLNFEKMLTENKLLKQNKKSNAYLIRFCDVCGIQCTNIYSHKKSKLHKLKDEYMKLQAAAEVDSSEKNK